MAVMQSDAVAQAAIAKQEKAEAAAAEPTEVDEEEQADRKELCAALPGSRLSLISTGFLNCREEKFKRDVEAELKELKFAKPEHVPFGEVADRFACSDSFALTLLVWTVVRQRCWSCPSRSW